MSGRGDVRGIIRGSVVAGLAVLVVGAGVQAQSVRGWVGSTVQFVELQPIGPVSTGCAAGVACYTALGQERAFAATQDVGLTVWGLGVTGLSATTVLRGRERLGSDFFWPRSDDRFDAILAYAQLVRGPFTLKAGRQEIRSGLGFPSFDGASLVWYSGQGWLRLEAYGGRSLARGLRQPIDEALRGIEDFVPDGGVLLVGGAARTRLRNLSLTARYQREVRSDRSALESDRGSLDVSLAMPSGHLTGSLDYDFAQERVGKGRLTWSRPLRDSRWLISLTALRYVPYFSLSTIWGFFEPVQYVGAEARVAWSRSATLGLWSTFGWRRYGEAGTTTVLRPLSDTGRRAGLGVRWAFAPALTIDGHYDLEWGPGAFLSSADAGVRWALSDALTVSGTLTSFQRIEQFRLGDGRGLGVGVGTDLAFSERISLGAGLSVLRHTGDRAGTSSPWNQARGWTSLRLLVGEDPGLANRRPR